MIQRIGSLFKPKGTKYWYMKVRADGVWRNFSTGFTSKAQADKFRQRCMERVSSGKNPFKSEKGITLSALFERYTSHCIFYNSPNTVNDRKRYCKRLLDFFGNIEAGLITRGDVDAYKTHRLKEHSKPKTTYKYTGNRVINEELKTLRQAFNYAVDIGLLKDNPAQDFGRLPERKREIKVLLKEELDRYFAWCRDNDRLLHDVSIIAFHLGLRKSDILKIRVDDIDFASRKIRVEMGKTGEILNRHINDRVLEVVKTRNLAWLFPSENSKSGHVEDIHKRFKRALKATGLNFEFRDLRANHAIHLRLSGADRLVVLRSLGHVDETTLFKYYMELAEGEDKEALDTFAKYTR